ncbi:MAG: DNA polymerase III subunit gamma/tau [Thermoleophilia bacterium]|nr:DNA polymerase III subunit gamma/tau [Thermoleophilia bacterium]
MAYEVIARKWRPQQFDDVVGQEHVTETLKNALKTDRVAHAYLFVGPRGVGKTSTARILAKALNCEKGPTATPCDKCDACKEIMAGNSFDVLEIDAASNTGVDNVRDLRDNVRYAPARGPFKVYIIDEVHMLSIAAFNALLKTLEEPPPHVKFVFATTEPQKMPATILSRCQRFDLRRISTKDIVTRLSEIAKAEKIDIDEDALLAVARGAEGGLRDAESALDQLIAFKGKTIREADVLAVFGLAARHTLDELALSVLKGDVPRAIKLVAELDESGKDLQRVVLELLEHFRNVLIFLYAGESLAGTDLTEAQTASVKAHAGETSAERVLRVVDVLTEAENRMRYALSRRTLLEVALIRGARAAVVVTLDEIMAHLDELRGSGCGESVAAAAPPATAGETSAGETRAAPQAAGGDAPLRQVVREKLDEEGERQLLAEKWHEIVERVGHAAVLAKGYLLDAKPARIEGQVVTVGFDPEFAANKEKIDFPRNRKAIQRAMSDILRRDVSVEFCVLDAKSTVPGDIKMADSARDTASGEGEPKKPPSPASRKTKQEWIQNPAVRKTLDMFDGDIVDVRE